MPMNDGYGDAGQEDEPRKSSATFFVEAYQVVVQKLNVLAAKSCTDPEFNTMISPLAGQIAQLRTLNPYYRLREIQAEVIPAGVPAVYGEDLSVSFDNVQESINVLREFDLTYGQRKIPLAGADLERYIRTSSEAACKYCCIAQTMVREDGTAACGCEHSQAMRGLTAEALQAREAAGEEGIQEILEEFPEFMPEMVSGC